MPRRTAFFISDRTGITVESMGDALLNQFEVNLKRENHPFIDSPEKAHQLVNIINATAEKSALRPLVFSSIVDEEIRNIVKSSAGLHLSFFDAFLGTLEKELGVSALQFSPRINSIINTERYDARMESLNFTLNHDDGSSDRNLQHAEVILIGVSRSGKTPTCLYLALQYGIRAANYPLTPEDLQSPDLPNMVKPFRNKLFGLTIAPERLSKIRQERRPNSEYADILTCKREVSDAKAMFYRFNLPYANTTHKSVEELAVHIMQTCHLKRRY